MDTNIIKQATEETVKMLNETVTKQFSFLDPVIFIKDGEVKMQSKGLLSTTLKLIGVEIEFYNQLRPGAKPYRYNGGSITYVVEETRLCSLNITDKFSWTDDKIDEITFRVNLSKSYF